MFPGPSSSQGGDSHDDNLCSAKISVLEVRYDSPGSGSQVSPISGFRPAWCKSKLSTQAPSNKARCTEKWHKHIQTWNFAYTYTLCDNNNQCEYPCDVNLAHSVIALP